MNDSSGEEMIPLTIDDTFNFSCNKKVACFTECCRDLNQFLTPYDILRLKNHLKMTSSDFLEKYTIQTIGPETGLPIIIFKTDYSADMKCPFVTSDGCSVYKDRPGSCRTYPLARLASRSRETGVVTEYFMLMKEPHCLGFKEQKSQTVREWINAEAIAEYNEINDLLMEIIGLKNRLKPGTLDLTTKHLFHIALYDLDTFRNRVFENTILGDYKPDRQLLDAAGKDDTALLKIGLDFIKNAVFQT